MILSFHRKSILHSSKLTKFIWNKIEYKKNQLSFGKGRFVSMSGSFQWGKFFDGGKLTGHQWAWILIFSMFESQTSHPLLNASPFIFACSSNDLLLSSYSWTSPKTDSKSSIFFL